MITYVLVIILYGSKAVAMHDFTSQQSCEQAAKEVSKMDLYGMMGGNGINVLCVKK